MKILLVDPNSNGHVALASELTANRYVVNVASDSQTGLELAQTCSYDLILLNASGCRSEGLSFCQQLRSQNCQFPVLLITEDNSSDNRIASFEAGADDCLAEPFNLSDLLTHLRNLMRQGPFAATPVLAWGKLRLDTYMGEARVGEQLLQLLPRELDILELLLRNPKRIFSRNAIFDRLWDFSNAPIEASVTSLIQDLQQKFTAAGLAPDVIESVYGLGYRLKPFEDESSEWNASAMQDANASSKIDPIMAQFWQRFKSLFSAQLGTLERAVTAALSHGISAELLQQAIQDAHRLSGSLGIFGYPTGSPLAKEVEDLLRRGVETGSSEAITLEALVRSLRQLLQQPPDLGTSESAIASYKRVLVIDDDVELVNQLKTEGIAYNYQVEAVSHPLDAWDAIARTLPDAILLNLGPLETSDTGLNLMAELAQRHPSLPILVFMEPASAVSRATVARLGGQAFLPKPIDIKQIFEAIAQVVGQHQPKDGHVLVVGHAVNLLNTVCAILEPWGLQVTVLSEPAYLQDTLFEAVPDVVLLDIGGSSLSDLELCQTLRKNLRWGNLPILALVQEADPNVISQIFAAGSDDYVCQPIVAPELISRILSRIDRTRLLWRATRNLSPYL